MRDELTDEQRARVCILETVLDMCEAQLCTAFDVVRCGAWVETGRNPDDVGSGDRPAGVTMSFPDQATSAPITAVDCWSPAVR